MFGKFDAQSMTATFVILSPTNRQVGVFQERTRILKRVFHLSSREFDIFSV
jgi:hypothetical protein